MEEASFLWKPDELFIIKFNYMRKIIFFLISLALTFSTFGQEATHVIEISDDIKILKLSEKAYVHISVTEIPPYGNNGLIFLDGREAFLFELR